MSSEFDLFLGPIINATFFARLFLRCNNDADRPIYSQPPHKGPAVYQIFCTYTMNVTDFGEAIRLLFTPRSINAAIILGGIIDHSVQAFFVARVYRVTGALYVSIGLWTMVAFLQGVSLKLVQESIHLDSIVLLGQKSSWLLSALFFGDASLDIVMASVLIYYLTQQKRTAFKRYTIREHSLIRRHLVLTVVVETGLATSFVAMGAALSFKFAPNYYIWTAFVILMPGSFTIALLANINSRRSLIQPVGPVSTGADPLSLESGVVITYSRNVVISRDAREPMRSQQDLEVEDKHSAADGIYGTPNV
ncbi:hypothetical protein B0H14DRAFT_2596607 [Mycena olivaceomarginata]|nr:hypothetical protein B0H14DRAFT_2596607 [Mycena olivaceomarginata]